MYCHLWGNMIQYKTLKNVKRRNDIKMIEFHTPSIDDLDWVRACLAASPKRACDYNFINILAVICGRWDRGMSGMPWRP